MTVSETIHQHIGWLKIYVEGMTPDNWVDMRCERQLNELTAVLSDQVVVPKEPTEEMVRAAYADQPGVINGGFAQAYRAMIAAAPPPSSTAGEGK